MNTATGRQIPCFGLAITAIITLASATIASGCINEYSTLLSGKVIMDEGGHCPLSFGSVDRAALQAKLDSLDALGTENPSGENLSDRGVLLIYLGRYDEALVQFRELRGFDPYTVCANMGTTFELMGKNDSALFYIRKAVEINPGAHDGSEWIHVKILERKVALEDKSRVQGALLGFSFGENELPVAPEGFDLSALRSQLRYQLKERMTFVKPPEAIVGELLFELGNIEAFSNSVECAVDVYDVSKEYGFASEVFARRYAKLSGMTGKATILNAIHPATDQDANWITYLFYGTLAALPIALLWGLWRLLRRPRAR